MGLLGGSLPRRVSCDCPGTAWSRERLAFALAPVCLAELWREFPLAGACPDGCPARALALLGLASALRLPWHLSAWRSCGGSFPRWAALGVPCVCPGSVWSDGCPARALALLGLASALRLPWHLSAWRSCGGSFPWRVLASASAYLGVACPDGCPAIALALLGLASALRVPWHLSAWRSCGGSFPWRAALGAPCDCPGTAWSSERLARALAPVCLAELWREFPLAGCLRSALRLPWHCLV